MYYIDIGNSYAKITDDFDNFVVLETENIIEWLSDKDEDNVILCSVAFEITNKISKLYPNIKIIDTQYYDKLIEIDNDSLYKKGSDRIVTGFAALNKYSKNIIVVDMGTCVTVDVYINSKYKSGFIYPGLEILRVALNERVQHLPLVVNTSVTSSDIIDTNDQIFWGNIYGMIGAINQFIKYELEKYNEEINIILTGGTIKAFNEFLNDSKIEDLFNFNYKIDEKLIFDGLKMISKNIKLNK